MSALYIFVASKKYLARFRWIKKSRLVLNRQANCSLSRKLAYVFWDPEIDTFSYSVEAVLGLEPLLRDLGISEGCSVLSAVEPNTLKIPPRRILLHKRKVFLGRYAAISSIIRGLKPDLVVELGVKSGLSSIVYRRVLGNIGSGSYVGVDVDVDAGYLDAHRTVICDSLEFLKAVHPVGRAIVISDTLPTEEQVRQEIELARKHVAERLIFIQNMGWSEAVSDAAKAQGRRVWILQDVVAHPATNGRGLIIGDLGRNAWDE